MKPRMCKLGNKKDQKHEFAMNPSGRVLMPADELVVSFAAAVASRLKGFIVQLQLNPIAWGPSIIISNCRCSRCKSRSSGSDGCSCPTGGCRRESREGDRGGSSVSCGSCSRWGEV